MKKPPSNSELQTVNLKSLSYAALQQYFSNFKGDIIVAKYFIFLFKGILIIFAII